MGGGRRDTTRDLLRSVLIPIKSRNPREVRASRMRTQIPGDLKRRMGGKSKRHQWSRETHRRNAVRAVLGVADRIHPRLHFGIWQSDIFLLKALLWRTPGGLQILDIAPKALGSHSGVGWCLVSALRHPLSRPSLGSLLDISFSTGPRGAWPRDRLARRGFTGLGDGLEVKAHPSAQRPIKPGKNPRDAHLTLSISSQKNIGHGPAKFAAQQRYVLGSSIPPNTDIQIKLESLLRSSWLGVQVVDQFPCSLVLDLDGVHIPEAVHGEPTGIGRESNLGRVVRVIRQVGLVIPANVLQHQDLRSNQYQKENVTASSDGPCGDIQMIPAEVLAVLGRVSSRDVGSVATPKSNNGAHAASSRESGVKSLQS